MAIASLHTNFIGMSIRLLIATAILVSVYFIAKPHALQKSPNTNLFNTAAYTSSKGVLDNKIKLKTNSKVSDLNYANTNLSETTSLDSNNSSTPKSTLTVNGQKIKLPPDSSFNKTITSPNGRINITYSSSTNNSDQGSTSSINVNSQTSSSGSVGQTSEINIDHSSQ